MLDLTKEPFRYTRQSFGYNVYYFDKNIGFVYNSRMGRRPWRISDGGQGTTFAARRDGAWMLLMRWHRKQLGLPV